MESTHAIFKIKKSEKHDPRYFAMLNDAVAVMGDDKYEGGNAIESSEYYHYLLNLEIPNLPSSLQLKGTGPLQLTEEEFNSLNKGINQIKEMAKDFKSRETRSTLFTDRGIKELIDEIDDVAKKNNGACYLPSGWIGSPGHYVTLKMRPLGENGHYALSILNQGEGMQYHRLLATSGGKEKDSYQSEEYEVDLNSESGKELLKKILELNYSAHSQMDIGNVVKGYSSDDLYGHIKLEGQELPLTSKLNEKAVTSQRAGSCSVTNLHAAGKDILIDRNVDFKKLKRYHFILKLRSIMAAYDDYCKNECPRNILSWALNEFSTRLNKDYGDILSLDEITFCGELKKIIDDKLKNDELDDLAKKCSPAQFPNAIAAAPENAILALKKTESTSEISEVNEESRAEAFPKITPENFSSVIGNFGNRRPFNFLYDFFNSLPRCSGDAKDAFWDKVPESDIGSIISKLSDFAGQLRSNPNLPPQERARTFALALILYDIAAQLAPRYKDEFYGGFKLGNRYSFGLDDIYSEQTFFTDPVAYQTVKRIANNFAKRSQGKERVFTNAVNYDDKQYDKTIDYVINGLLTHAQRKEIAKAKKEEEQLDDDHFSDEELFEYLINHIDMSYQGNYVSKKLNYQGMITVLDPKVVMLIGIAATAHSLGEHKKTYKKVELSADNDINAEQNTIYSFDESRFQYQLMREMKLPQSKVAVHLPKIDRTQSPSSSGITQYTTYAESTNYHPENDLIDMQYAYKNLEDKGLNNPARSQPYQLHLSGSLNPDSKIWSPAENHRLIFQSLNTALRHIECSPHLQIQRTLAFISNNVDKLRFPEIRERVNSLLFQYGKLDHALANQFAITVFNIDKMLASVLKQCKESPRAQYDFVKSSSDPKRDIKENTNKIPLINNSGYILFDGSLYYVDKVKKICDEIPLSSDAVKKLDQQFKSLKLNDAHTLNHEELKVIQEITQHNVPEDHSFLKWAAELSIGLRNQVEVAAKLYQFPIEKYSLPDFQSILLTTIQRSNNAQERAKLASLVVQNFQYQSPLTLHECCILLTCRLIANLGEENLSCDNAWNSLNKEMQLIFKKDPKQFQKTFASVQSDYIQLAEKPVWEFKDAQLNMRGSDNYINLRSGALESKTLKDLKDRTQRTKAENRQLFDKLGLTKNQKLKLLYSNNDYKEMIHSSDGLWEFTYKKELNSDNTTKFEIKKVFQWFDLDGYKTKFKYMDQKKVKKAYSKNPFEISDSAGQNYQYWQSTTDKNVILVQNAQDKSQIYFSYREDDLILISKNALKFEANKSDVNDFKIEDAMNTLEKISKRNNNAPILIKSDDNKDNKHFHMYGLVDGKWCITEVASTKDNDLEPFKKIKFKYLDDTKIKMGQLNYNARKQIIAKKAHQPPKDNIIRQYQRAPVEEQSNLFQFRDHLYLNLVNPSTPFEKEWAQRLQPIFGIDNVRCIAKLSADKKTWQLESIEHLALGLSFSMNHERQKLICDQDPEYHLSTQQSIPEINGLPNIIILENEKGQKKYIVPAFALDPGEKNNNFNTDHVVNYQKLCNPASDGPSYYIYSFNSKGEFVADNDNPAASLYLAILYRSIGHFEKAMHYLQSAKMPRNITPEILAIAMQTSVRKIKSPLAAAFDLKLHCYIVEHQNKWVKTKDSNEDIKQLPGTWKKMIKAQFDFYNQTFSHYKTGIAIIPEYLRLTNAEKEIIIAQKKKMEIEKAEKQAYKKPNKNSSTGTTIPTLPTTRVERPKRLGKIAQLPNYILNQSSGWESYVSHIKREVYKDTKIFNDIPKKLEFLRLFPDRDKSKTLPFLITHFNAYLKDALSGDVKCIKQLHKNLFTLLQNDADPNQALYDFISLLLFVSKYPEHFKNYKVESDSFDNIINIGNIFEKNKKDFANKTVYLFEFEFSIDNIKQERSFSNEFSIPKLKFAMNTRDYEKTCKHPLSNVVKTYFKPPKKVAIAKRDFKLNLEEGLPDASLIEKRVFESYKRGHEQNKQQYKTVYEVEKDDLPGLKKELLAIKKHDQEKIKEIKRALSKLANHTLVNKPNATTKEKALSHQLIQARRNGSKRKLKINDIVTAFIHQDPTYLTKENPFLTQEDIAEIFALFADVALLNSRVEQINQVMTMVEKTNSFAELTQDKNNYQLQLLANTLDKERYYNVADYPEFIVYEYATGRMLRKDQLDTLVKLIALIERDPANIGKEMHHALLQFAAGGGKTSVLIPILSERFARKGFLPVIFNTPELYQLGLEEIPKNLRDSFKQNLEVVERELEHQWTTKEFQKLLEDLESWRQQKKCVLLKPVTWHAINITMRLAYLNKDVELAQAANNVLQFFKTNAVKLEDESHITSDPMQQSIKTYGEHLTIPEDQLQLLLHAYDFLLGNINDSEAVSIAQLAGIKNDRKRPIDPDKELKPLKLKLIQIFVNYITAQPIFKNSKIKREQILAYLEQPDKTRPEWLNNLFNNLSQSPEDLNRNKALANLIVLSRAFLNTHLPHILDMQYLKDFGPSIHPGDLTAAPKHESKDVTSHFGDPILVAALTIQLIHKRGLMIDQVEQFINQILKAHQEERNWNFNFNEPTEAEGWLLSLIPEKYNITSIYELTDEMKMKLAQDESFTKNPEIVNRYLKDFALPQVKVPKYRQTSTAADLQNGFLRSIMFSATPSLRETYPAFIKPENYFTEEAFEAQVIDVLLDLKNEQFHLLSEAKTPDEFFKQFPSDLLQRMTTVIDRGSLLTDFKAEQVIEAYLGIEEGKAKTKTAAFFEQQNIHLKTQAKNIKEKIIAGTGLIEELKKQGIDPRDLAVFLFYDLSKTTGTDVKRPFTDHAGLTAGLKQTVTQIIQAAMRERQLLDEDAQTITWLLFQSLYHMIDPAAEPGTFDAKKLMYWMLKNEAKDIEAKIINRAYQGIYQEISNIAWQETAKNPEKVDLPDGFKDLLTEEQSLAPFEVYELDSSYDGTKKVLEGYKNQLIHKFKYTERDIPIRKETEDRINQIITETAHLISQLPSPPKSQLGNEVQQEMKTQLTEQQKQQQQQQVKVQNKNDTARDFVYKLEVYSLANDNLRTIFDPKHSRYAPLKLPGCENVQQPKLLFCAEHFAVTEKANKNIDEPINELKPVNLILVKIMPDHSMQYCACTAAGAEYYSYLINNNLLTQQDPAYAIITIDGWISAMSNNIDLATCHDLVNNEDSKKICAYAEMLNGNLTNPLVLHQVIKDQRWKQEDYNKLANAVTAVHVAQTPINLLNNKMLENLCGWATPKDKVIAHVDERNQKGKYRAPTKPKLNQSERKKLRKRDQLENRMESSAISLGTPQTALEGHLIGKKTMPIVEQSKEDAILVTEFNKINVFFDQKDKKIPCRDLAVVQLTGQSKQILNSLLNMSEKISALKSLREELFAFDAIVSELYKQLQKDFQNKKSQITEQESGREEDPLEYSASALQMIEKAYANIGRGVSIQESSNDLVNALNKILDDIKKEQTKNQKSGMSKTSTFSSPFKLSIFSSNFNKSVLTSLRDAVTQLEKQSKLSIAKSIQKH